MITKEQAKMLQHGTILHHVSLKNADGSPVRCRINGKVKTWQRQPDAFRLLVKYGLKDCFYITERNANEWTIAQDN